MAEARPALPRRAGRDRSLRLKQRDRAGFRRDASASGDAVFGGQFGAFAEYMTREKGVAGIPISVFNLDREDHRQLRFCFAKKSDTLLRAVEILRRL